MSSSQRVAALAPLLVALSHGPVRAESPDSPTTRLTPELRAVFIAEMQQLDAGLQRTVSGVVRADWNAVEHVALEMKGSFILEQRLGAEQREELERALPEGFLGLDRALHEEAGRLAAAARERDAERAAFEAQRISSTCLSCHAQYARHRFPDLALPHPERSEVEQLIRDSERAWAESVASGDPSTLEKILADDFVGVDPKGVFYGKAEMIADTRNAPKHFVSNHLNEVRVRFFGSDTAVAQGDETWERRSGERGRFVWTDTWVRRGGRWQIVAAEDLVAPAAPAQAK